MERETDRIKGGAGGGVKYVSLVNITHTENEQALFIDLCFLPTQDGGIRLLVVEN